MTELETRLTDALKAHSTEKQRREPGCSAGRMRQDFHYGLLVSCLTQVFTQAPCAAPDWQGVTKEHSGAFVTEEQRRQAGCPTREL